MASPDFSASDEELRISTRLLETNNWHTSDTLSVDAIIDTLKQSGLTFKQIRDIWSIADKKGSGTLTKLELAVVVRLMGWVQAGEPLREGLLASGPMPFIKGITDTSVGSLIRPTNNSQVPLINPVDVERFEIAFKGANPVNGILSRERATVTLLRNGLSYNSVRKIIDLVDGSHEIDFAKFALAFHLGDLLQSWKITSLPSVIPQYLRDQVAFFNIHDPLPPPPPLQLWIPSTAASSLILELPNESDDKGGPPSASQKLESDLLLMRSQIEENGCIPGETILKFKTDHKVKSSELARIWYVATELEQIRGSSTLNKNNRLTGVFLDLFLDRLKEKLVGQDDSKSSSHTRGKALPSYPVQVDDTYSSDSFSSSPSHSPAFPVMKVDPHASLTSFRLSDPASPSNISDISNLFSPLSPTSPALLANESFGGDARKKIKTKIKEAANLLLRVKRNSLCRSHQQNQPQTNQNPFDEKSLKMVSLPSVKLEYFQGQEVADSKMLYSPPLPSLQPLISSSPASPLALMPKDLPAESDDNHPIAQYEDNLGVWSSVENIRVGRGSRADSPISRGCNNEWNDSSGPLSSTGRVSVEDIHSPSDESASTSDVVSTFGWRLSSTSQATTIDPFPYDDEYTRELGPPTPAHSQHMECLPHTSLWNGRRDSAKDPLHIEQCPQLDDRSQDEGEPLKIAQLYDRHQAELRILTKKLRDKEAECERLKKTQKSIFALQVNLSDARKRTERLQDTIDRQHQVILSLESSCFCSDIAGRSLPPSYEEKPLFSTSESSGW